MNSAGTGDRATTFESAGGTARLMFYALLAITLMALDYRGHYVERFQSIAGQLVEPIFWAVDLPFSGVERLSVAWRERNRVARRVDELELELARARARLGRLQDLTLENAQLRALLETRRRTEHDFVAAELANIDLDPFAHRLMVRRGRSDGIQPGMPVVDARGVLGQVDQVFTRLSRIVLITDPDHALPVQILPGGERTIAYGSGSLDLLRLTDLPMNADISPGNLIVTSGIGGRFAPGLPVARVDSIRRQPGQAFATALATTLSAMDRNRLVLIMKPDQNPVAEPTRNDDAETNPAEQQAGQANGPEDQLGAAPEIRPEDGP